MVPKAHPGMVQMIRIFSSSWHGDRLPSRGFCRGFCEDACGCNSFPAFAKNYWLPLAAVNDSQPIGLESDGNAAAMGREPLGVG